MATQILVFPLQSRSELGRPLVFLPGSQRCTSGCSPGGDTDSNNAGNDHNDIDYDDDDYDDDDDDDDRSVNEQREDDSDDQGRPNIGG